MAAILALTALTGCDDPKAATKENFQKALVGFFDRTCARITPLEGLADLNALKFPATVTPAGNALPRYEALADAHLLFRTGVGMAARYPGERRPVRFTLTDKGRTLFKPANTAGSPAPAGFCAGRIEVVSVDGFTEPTDSAGRRLSQVTFTAAAHYDDWTKAPGIQAAFRQQLSHAAPASLTFPMVSMDDGWAVANVVPK